MKLIIADTGPILQLEEADVPDFLPRLGKVHVTPAVLSELHRRSGWTRPAWLQVDQPSAKALREARAWTNSGLLHAGEAESLAHAKELPPDYFLTDDTAARTAGETAGLHVRGSLGVVLACAALRLCSREEAEKALDNLERRSTLWLSARVKLEARKALAAILPTP